MLHKITMPVYRAQLEAILHFQGDLLSFACAAPALPLTPAALTIHFGAQIGPWLSERCWEDKAGIKKTKFGEELEGLVAHIAKNSSEGPDILNAFNNDRDFYQHLDDPDFEFQYPRLTLDAKKAIKPLMIAFYNRILRNGFPAFIHSGATEKFTYSMLLKGFYEANLTLRVCPSCDGPHPRPKDGFLEREGEEQEEEEESKRHNHVQVDHFFAKADFPFFSVHFTNLVPLCRNCNLDKNDGNPLGRCSGKGALRHTFVPFLRPAVSSLEVVIAGSISQRLRVRLKDTQQPSSERMKNLNTIWRLSARWEDHLEGWIKEEILRIKIDFQEKPRRKKDRRETEKAIRKKLNPIADTQEEYIGQLHNLIVQRGYAKYALGNRLELEALIGQVMDDNAPNPKRRW